MLTIASHVPTILAVHRVLAYAAVAIGKIRVCIRPLAHALSELRVVTPIIPVPVAVVVIVVVILVIALVEQIPCRIAS